jgi:hypothetical protein
MPSAEPENIQVFNYFVLKVLTKLYDKFPEPTEINGVRFLVPIFKKGRGTMETKYYFLFPHTMAWLREEGFIKFESGSATDHFKNVTLTLRGLTILGYVPQCLGRGRKKTIAERARHALSKGVGEAVSDVAKTLIVEGFKFMLQ